MCPENRQNQYVLNFYALTRRFRLPCDFWFGDPKMDPLRLVYINTLM
jgi:hypothetical protein